MPRFFFDLDDGDHRSIDHEGIKMVSLDDARRRAVTTLPELARDVLPDGDKHVIAAVVRDEAGRVRITATLTLVVEVHAEQD